MPFLVQLLTHLIFAIVVTLPLSLMITDTYVKKHVETKFDLPAIVTPAAVFLAVTVAFLAKDSLIPLQMHHASHHTLHHH